MGFAIRVREVGMKRFEFYGFSSSIENSVLKIEDRLLVVLIPWPFVIENANLAG